MFDLIYLLVSCVRGTFFSLQDVARQVGRSKGEREPGQHAQGAGQVRRGDRVLRATPRHLARTRRPGESLVTSFVSGVKSEFTTGTHVAVRSAHSPPPGIVQQDIPPKDVKMHVIPTAFRRRGWWAVRVGVGRTFSDSCELYRRLIEHRGRLISHHSVAVLWTAVKFSG